MVKRLHKLRRFLFAHPRRFELLLLLVLSLGLSFCIRAANQPDSQNVQTRAQVGGGKIYHVRQDGSGDCTAPQQCVDKLQPGDTLWIHTGTYPGFSIGNLSGSAGAPITIKAAPGEHAVLDGSLKKDSSETAFALLGVIDGHGPSYVVFGDSDGQLEITNTDPFIDLVRQLDMGNQNDVNTYTSTYRNDPRIQMGGFQLEGGGHANHMTFQYLTIHHFFGGGLPGTDSDSNYLYNTVYDLGYPHSGYGCYCNGSRMVFRGNVFHDMTIGFHLYDGSGSHQLTDSVVENNIIYNISLKPWYHGSSGTVKHGGAGIVAWPSSNVSIQHNIVYGVNGSGIETWGSGNKVWYNTMFKNVTGATIDSGVDAQNTIFYQNQSDLSGGTMGAGNYTQDPLFVNAPTDFHLKQGSGALTASSTGGEVGAYGGGVTCVGADCGTSTTPRPSESQPSITAGPSPSQGPTPTSP